MIIKESSITSYYSFKELEKLAQDFIKANKEYPDADICIIKIEDGYRLKIDYIKEPIISIFKIGL